MKTPSLLNLALQASYWDAHDIDDRHDSGEPLAIPRRRDREELAERTRARPATYDRARGCARRRVDDKNDTWQK